MDKTAPSSVELFVADDDATVEMATRDLKFCIASAIGVLGNGQCRARTID